MIKYYNCILTIFLPNGNLCSSNTPNTLVNNCNAHTFSQKRYSFITFLGTVWLIGHLVFLAPPAERQQSFSNFELSVVRLSVRQDWRGGGRCQSQKHFFSFFGMELLWDDIIHISKSVLNRSNGHLSRTETSHFPLCALGDHLFKNGSVTFSLFLA